MQAQLIYWTLRHLCKTLILQFSVLRLTSIFQVQAHHLASNIHVKRAQFLRQKIESKLVSENDVVYRFKWVVN